MALSNKFGWLVLATGNKSEMSVGYTTLYGDLAGGFAVIKDVPKTLVYRLCTWRNSPAGGAIASRGGPRTARGGRRAQPIPTSIIERAPSAELRPRPARRGLAAALRGARPHPRGLRRARPERRAADRAGAARAADVRAHDPARGPRRVQAPPGSSRASRSPRARSAATGACRSPTATGARRRAQAGAPPTLRACVPAVPRRSPRCARSGWARAATRCRSSRSRHNMLEGLIARPFPVYWLGGSFHGMAVTEVPATRAAPQRAVRQLPAGRPGHLRAAAAGGHLARQQLPARRRHAHRAGRHQRHPRVLAQAGSTVVLATGRGGRRHLRHQIAHWPRQPLRTMVADQRSRRARSALPAALPNTRLRRNTAAAPGAAAAAPAQLSAGEPAPGRRSARRAHRDRHPRDRARLPCVVAEAHVPHPGRAAAVQSRRVSVDRCPR